MKLKLIEFYSWMAGSMSDFTKTFQENEALFNQAKGFWRHLDSSMIVVVAIFVVLGISLAAYYYKPYNNVPGRHYKPSCWLAFLGITFIATFALTLGFEFGAVKPVLNGAAMLEIKVALCNAIYAVFLYIITSVVWCNALPTNAYRLFKPKSKV